MSLALILALVGYLGSPLGNFLLSGPLLVRALHWVALGLCWSIGYLLDGASGGLVGFLIGAAISFVMGGVFGEDS